MPDIAPTYLHGHHDSVLRSHRWRTAENSAAYLIPYLGAGARVLDVGCGPGTITVGLARYVGTGHVLGIDAAETVLADARDQARRAGQDNVAFEAGDVGDLGFVDGSFDVVHAHQVLQHLPDPVGALAEMRRVCRPNGVVTARDGDYGAMFWFPEDSELEEWRSLYEQVARQVGGEPHGGRFLASWARRAGFSAITTSSSSWCFATPDERWWWGELWAERVTRSTFAQQAMAANLAHEQDLERLARAWRRWASSVDGLFVIPHVEIVCQR